MKISVAQTNPIKNNLESNISGQIALIEKAKDSDLIVFPELSVQGYHAKTAAKVAMNLDDKRLKIFKEKAEEFNLIIATSLPLKTSSKPYISLVFYFPNGEVKVYSKRYLHYSEKPYFSEGKDELFIEIEGNMIAPAICYEVAVPEHAEMVASRNANIYLASVAKNKDSIERNIPKLIEIAKKYKMTVYMSNQIGDCDDDIAYGNSCIINPKGEIIQLMGDDEVGVVTL